MTSPSHRGAEEESVDVLVVGAGVTGIYQLHRALQAGFSAVLVDAADGVGGTWYWNRYPGARFDSESYTYGYLFSRPLFDEWEWSEHFAAQPETERYLNHVVDRFDLRRHLRLGARVTSARWDDVTRSWSVTFDGRPPMGARYLVAATGTLSVPNFPGVPGREDFGGEQHHTARWPDRPVEVAGRHVAVVGTGSSGVQIVPAIADQVESLTVYQRTPHWCTPLNNRPITDAEQAQLRADFETILETLNTSPHGFLHQANDRSAGDDTEEARSAFFEHMWSSPGFSKLTSNYRDLLFDAAANDAWCEFLAGKIRGIVADRHTAEALIPKDHRYGEHRPPFVTGYYEAFNRPNVSLLDLRAKPILRVTENGIETADGARSFDLIVWATGFDFGTGALLRMGITGRGGVTLEQRWRDGPDTYLGLQTTGFPNLFFPGGPHSAAGNNPRYNGDQVDLLTDVLVHARAHGCDTIEPEPSAEGRWTAMIDKWGARSPSFGQRSFYFGSNIPGKPRRYLLNSAGRPKLLADIAEQRATGFAGFTMTGGPEAAAVATSTARSDANDVTVQAGKEGAAR